MLDEKFSARERYTLESYLPQEARSSAKLGMHLNYNYSKDLYEIRTRLPGKPSEVLETIPREEIKSWTRTRETLNYVARRALKDQGYPAQMRTVKLS